ncbi:hypothetical protein CBR_g37317 [Chara braunii]|uniref:Uncharacterized protein n=1 Tax=Chara braunii TaxID=69332 RepID=A0A388JZI9_CHABU|nr:hypothetical protein CBR_g37317 [Chara braunii]|eukprot:GBG63231.1 hypothetical protein CBR_g37317 [Chara braunii]
MLRRHSGDDNYKNSHGRTVGVGGEDPARTMMMDRYVTRRDNGGAVLSSLCALCKLCQSSSRSLGLSSPRGRRAIISRGQPSDSWLEAGSSICGEATAGAGSFADDGEREIALGVEGLLRAWNLSLDDMSDLDDREGVEATLCEGLDFADMAGRLRKWASSTLRLTTTRTRGMSPTEPVMEDAERIDADGGKLSLVMGLAAAEDLWTAWWTDPDLQSTTRDGVGTMEAPTTISRRERESENRRRAALQLHSEPQTHEEAEWNEQVEVSELRARASLGAARQLSAAVDDGFSWQDAATELRAAAAAGHQRSIVDRLSSSGSPAVPPVVVAAVDSEMIGKRAGIALAIKDLEEISLREGAEGGEEVELDTRGGGLVHVLVSRMTKVRGLLKNQPEYYQETESDRHRGMMWNAIVALMFEGSALLWSLIYPEPGAAAALASEAQAQIAEAIAGAAEELDKLSTPVVAATAHDAAKTVADATVPDWLGPSVVTFPFAGYILFYLYREKVNPRAKLTDFFFMVLAAAIVANLVLILTLRIRLW